MRSVLVILTGSQQAWQAVFIGYDLAARSGARLVGGVPMGLPEGRQADQLLAEFRTGARAAGATFSTARIDFMAGKLGGEMPPNLRAVLVGREDLHNPAELSDLLKGIHCALWVISGRRELRSVVALDLGNQAAGFLDQARAIAHDWGWRLGTVQVNSRPSERQPQDAGVPPLRVSQRQFIRSLSSEPADATLIPWPSEAISGWELLQAADRPLIFVPGA